MKKGLLFLFILMSSLSTLASSHTQTEYEKLTKEISKYLLKGTAKGFTKKYVPNKKDVLELAYQKKASQVPFVERLGFYNGITPTIYNLKNNHYMAFGSLQEMLKEKGISALESIELNSVQDEAFGDATVKKVIFTIYGSGKSFKIEITGAYKTSRGWIIMTDIAPSYF